MKHLNKIALFCTGSNSPTEDDAKNTQHYFAEHFQIDMAYTEDTYTRLPAKKRAEFFLTHLFDSEIDALFALRGGEGTADTLPFIHQMAAKISLMKPKIILGFSDVTALLVYFSQVHHWPTLHAPGALQFIHEKIDKKSKAATINFLSSNLHNIQLDNFVALNSHAKTKPTLQAECTGGNLSLLNISIKDLWELNAKDKIIIIEDINEKPHAIFRTLKYLKRIGCFNEAKAILFGDISLKSSKENLSPVFLEILTDFAESCNFPVFKTDSFGHGCKNLPIPFGIPVILNSQEARLSW